MLLTTVMHSPHCKELLGLNLNSGVPGGLKNLPANAGDTGDTDSTPGSSRYSGQGHGNPLQYSCLENPMDRWAIVHGVTKNWTQQSD